jgi:hypothetical protein
MSSKVFSALPGAGWTVVLGRINGEGAITFTSTPVLSFAVREDKSVAPIVVNVETNQIGQVEDVYPEVLSGEASYRLVVPGSIELSAADLAVFESLVRGRHSSFVAAEKRRAYHIEYVARLNSPEAKAARKIKNDAIIAATKARLDSERTRRTLEEAFAA